MLYVSFYRYVPFLLKDEKGMPATIN